MSAEANEFPVRQPLAAPILLTVLLLLVLLFCALAVMNLTQAHENPLQASLGSGLWLLIVGLVIWGALREYGGLGAILRRVLGVFVLRHFVWIEDEDARRLMSYGFRVLGRRIYLLRVQIEGITSVGWHSGQASDVSGRDCSDWSVAVWFDAAFVLSVRPRRYGPDESDVEIIGPTGARASVEQFGLRLVEFLRSAGVQLQSREGGQVFRRVTAY